MDHIELIMRIFSDPLSQGEVDALFLFGQTGDNESSVLDQAADLCNANPAMKVLMVQAGTVSGYPGFEAWKEALVGRGNSRERVIGVPVADTASLNSLTEAQAAVRYAKAQGLATLGICAAPFHHYRAFLTAATVALREYPELELRSYPGKPLSWDERAVHSQGVDSGSRAQLLAAEIQRIATYQAKGDMASSDDLLCYVRQRGRRTA